MKANTGCALRHQQKLTEGGNYNVRIRYANSNKAGNLRVSVNGVSQNAAIQKTGVSDWLEAVVPVTSFDDDDDWDGYGYKGWMH